MGRNARAIASLIGWLAVSGCATVQTAEDYADVSERVRIATGQNVAIDPQGERKSREVSAELLQDGITAQEAMQLALLNNPRLQAAFLRVGIGRAAVVQSSLFANPTLSFATRFPDEGGLANLEVSLAQNIAELWQIRPRVRAAERALDQTVLSLAREASLAALDTHSAYIRVLQADRQLEIARENRSIAERLVEVAVARREVGSGTEVEVNLARAERVALDVAGRTAEHSAMEARTNLCRMLGLTLSPVELLLADALPETINLTLTPQQLMEAARAHRLDLKTAEAAAKAARARVDQERAYFLRTVEVGVSVERDARRSRGDRNWLAETARATAESRAFALPSFQSRESQSTDYVTGPTLSLELPLFDQNQAQIARAEFEWLQAEYMLEAIDREIVQESWAAHSRARMAFETAGFMRDELLPLRNSGLTLAREAYRIGGTTLLTVLDAQRRLLEARAGYVDLQAAAALARIELERIAGLPFQNLVGPENQPPVETSGIER